MPTPIATAANAYAALARISDETAKIGRIAGGGEDNSAPNFGAMLKDAIGAATTTADKADLQARAVATGKANMIDVVTAVAETETTVQTLVAVRDKVISAYEDILRMPI
jgi:flagellar hook-basal body complex protein FliE